MTTPTVGAKLLMPWVFEPEDVEAETGEFIRPRWWGTKPDGDLTLIAEFTVPLHPVLIDLLEEVSSPNGYSWRPSMNFNDVMVLTRKVSSPTAFEDAECEAYFNLLQALPAHALVVEVGLQFGRSSAIALQVAKANNLRYWGIDPFIEPPEAAGQWLALAHNVRLKTYTMSRLRSNEVVIGSPIDLILIDGDHTYQGVMDDCKHFMPLVRRQGYALFHDFGRHSLPEVYSAVRDYMDGNQHWREQEHVGTLGIWRRA